MQPLADFRAKTHTHLATLTAQAALVRRGMPTHRACPDRAACKPCAAIRSLHLLIDDDLDQLDLVALDPDPEPATCCTCGRRRYTNGTATACPACDGLPDGRLTWQPIADREPA